MEKRGRNKWGAVTQTAMYKVAVIARSFGGVKTPPYSTDR